VKKLFLSWKDLKWYFRLLVLLGLTGLSYFLLKDYIFLILLVVTIILLKMVWQALFCRAKKTNNHVEFNLSIFAEFALMSWYIASVCFMSYGLFTQSIPWYGYLIPGAILLVNLAKVFEVFGNRRDFIRISGCILTWKDGDKTGEFEVRNYFFEDRKTEAFEFKVSGEATGPFLIVINAENKEHSFDLKTMNLGGHYKALEAYFKAHFTEKKQP
jgi:hypothetical protein